MEKISKANYKKYLKAAIKAENERTQEDKQLWRSYLEDFELIQGLAPIQKAEAWLKHVMTYKFVYDSLDWASQFIINKFADQEALIYFISRGVDCNNHVKKMVARLKEHKKESESFWNFLETKSDNELKFFGFQKKKTRTRKADRDASYYAALSRSSFSLANDDEAYTVASMIRTFQWCDIGGYDMVWREYANRLNEDVNRGGEINSEIASHMLFDVCRSDFAIEVMGDNLVKLLDIVEMPDYQLTIPWHRWNYDDISLRAGIKTNSIFAYAASIAFAERRLRQDKTNQELVEKALKWLLEVQEENGAWKISTLLDQPSIMGTCMVVHALAINKPKGWKLAVSQACSWLVSQQDNFGFWYESPFPSTDPIYLTVLVLDTLNLAEENPTLTFRIEEKYNTAEKTAQININGNVSRSTIIVGNDNTIQRKKKVKKV
ncbi:MAG: hypothetical protein IH588_08290 [Anaerolineales bacterium]|nr:hypothetical protein [Anaerolineales bacterium]